jgi:pyrophosphatase PpaX
MKKYQLYLYDWDGCIAKTLNVWLESYKKLFSKYDIQISEQNIITKVFGDWEGPKKVGVKDNEQFTFELLNLVNTGFQNLELYPNAKETLIQLKQLGVKIAIVSTSKWESIKRAYESNNLSEFVDTVITAESVTHHKPDPESIFKAMAECGVTNKEEVVIIGDSNKDIVCGTNANIDTILFYPSENNKFYNEKGFKQSTFVITDHLDILE